MYIYTHTHVYYQAGAMQAAWGVQVCENKKKSHKATKVERWELAYYFVVCKHNFLFFYFILFYFAEGKPVSMLYVLVYFLIWICGVFFHVDLCIFSYWNIKTCCVYRVAKPIGCLKLQVIFRKRATDSRALLRKMTYEDKALYDSTPPCNISCWVNFSLFVFSHLELNFSCWIVFSFAACIFSCWVYFLTVRVFSHVDCILSFWWKKAFYQHDICVTACSYLDLYT